MPDTPLSTPNAENKKSRVSKAVALAILSPAILAISGCNSNCDSNRSTPQTSDDCGTSGRSGGYYRGGGSFGRSTGGDSATGTGRGGFGGLGRFFSGGG